MSNSLSTVVGVRINTLLVHRGLTQKDLAEYLGVKANTISYFVKGKRIPNTEQIYKIAVFFNVSADYLLGIPISVRQNTVIEIQKAIIKYLDHYKGALIYLSKIENLTHLLEAAKTSTDDETADEYAGVNRDFSGGRYDGT